VCTAVLQLLADKIVTPYAGGTPCCLVGCPLLAAWLAGNARQRRPPPANPANAPAANLRMPSTQRDGQPVSANALSCPASPPHTPASTLTAGQRFPLDNIVEAIGVATSAARGGKVLLEG
jgi:hypothetical protein